MNQLAHLRDFAALERDMQRQRVTESRRAIAYITEALVDLTAFLNTPNPTTPQVMAAMGDIASLQEKVAILKAHIANTEPV